jgi:hypothetical protein
MPSLKLSGEAGPGKTITFEVHLPLILGGKKIPVRVHNKTDTPLSLEFAGDLSGLDLEIGESKTTQDKG